MDSRERDRIFEALNALFRENPDLRDVFWQLVLKIGANLVEAGPKLRKIFKTSSHLRRHVVLDFLKEDKIIPRKYRIKGRKSSSSSSSVLQTPARRPEPGPSQNLMALAIYGSEGDNKDQEDSIANVKVEMQSVQTEPDDMTMGALKRRSDPGRSDYEERENPSQSQQNVSQHQCPRPQHQQQPSASCASQTQQNSDESWNQKRAIHSEDGSNVTIPGDAQREEASSVPANLEDGQRKRKQSRWGPPVANVQAKIEVENPGSDGGASQPPLNSSSTTSTSTSAMMLYNRSQPPPGRPPPQESVPTSFGARAQPPNYNSAGNVTASSNHLTLSPDEMQRDPPSASGVRRFGGSGYNRGSEDYAFQSYGLLRPRTSVVMKLHPKPERFDEPNRSKRRSTPEDGFLLRCQHCKKTFASPTGYRDHIKNKTCRGKHFLCKICPDGSGNIYASKERLKKHWMEAHGYGR